MGSLGGFSELPKFIIVLAFILTLIKKVLSLDFGFRGHDDMPEMTVIFSDENQENHEMILKRRVVMVVEEVMPVMAFKEVGRNVCGGCSSCMVCLHGFEEEEEVRKLSKCGHVFHSCCIDAWISHGWLTCPLCRAPLFNMDHLQPSDHYGDLILH
ncbi:hypothetical protein J5N97_025216 [Dioscorea zingiberensis]|uniref:RING-type domain-containing protein n=1 Tax=Dioscorea zingiberensis TaxID=325984 RepID=A0A9D5H9F9_9LILI|nr:hypothetical protein J5N97_025216 [Dioscorea zingiberensis]